MITHRSVGRGAALLLVASLATLMLPGIVAAHAELVTPTPADKATVPAPVIEVGGIYSEAMTPAGSSLLVKDASGTTIASGTVDPADTTRMVATPSTPLGAGSYSVEWTSNSADLHVERGTWTFTVTAAPPSAVAGSAAPSAAPSASAAVATPSASVGPTPLPSASGGTTGSGDVVLPIVVALIVIAAGAVYLLSRRNRPSNPT